MATHDTPALLSPASSGRSPARSSRLISKIITTLVVLLFGLSLLETVAISLGGALHGNDLKHLWAGASLLAHGHSPYRAEELFRVARLAGLGSINPYVYLPTTGLLMRPLTELSFPEARMAWFWFNWALAWLLVLAGPRLLRVDRPDLARLAGAAFLAGAITFFRQQTAGQMNVVAAGLILLAAVALRRQWPVAAGLALALGFAWKITPAFLIVAIAGQWRWRGAKRAALWGAGLSLALLLASIALLGWPVHREAWPVLRQMGYGQSTWAEYGMAFYRDPFNQSPNSLLHHLFTPIPDPTAHPWLNGTPALANGLTWLVSLALLGLWTWRTVAVQRREELAGDDQGQTSLFMAATLLMLLLPSLLWDHYVVQALPALLWAFGNERTAHRPARAILLLAILLLLGLPWIYSRWQSGPGLPLMALRLWPLLALYGLLLAETRRPAIAITCIQAQSTVESKESPVKSGIDVA